MDHGLDVNLVDPSTAPSGSTEPGSFLDLSGTGPQDRVNDGQCQGENGGGRTLLIAAIRSGLLDGTYSRTSQDRCFSMESACVK